MNPKREQFDESPEPFTGSGIFIKIHKQPHTERSHILGSKHFLKVAMQSSGLKDNFTTRLTLRL